MMAVSEVTGVNDKRLAGALLRMERMRQGLMLKQVCQGICVTSYLSKIEHGSADADDAMVEALFARLGIVYTSDEETLAPLRSQIEACMKAGLYELEDQEQFAALMAQDMLITYSPLCADWLILRGLHQHKVLEQLNALADCLTTRQRAWRDVLWADWNDYKSESMALIQQAANTLNCSAVLTMTCTIAFRQGDYAYIHRMEGRITSLALEEGNTYYLAAYYFLNGSAYACLNQEAMMMNCYQRVIHLLQNTQWRDILMDVYYNIGATLVNSRWYDEALAYLDRAAGAGSEMQISVAHKRALAYIRSGRLEQGRASLAQMDRLLSDACSDSWRLMLEEAEMECSEDFREDPAYLALMDRLFAAFRKETHFGYVYFYRDVYVEACTRQRQYKRALEFEQMISSSIHKSGY